MSTRTIVSFRASDYAGMDDTTTIPVGLTQLEASIAVSALQLLLNRNAWDATDAEFDELSSTIATLIEDVQSAI